MWPAWLDMTRNRLISKLDLAVIVASVVGAALWIEHGHRIVIETPEPADFALPAPAAACPDNDNVPYSASCIAFLQGSATPWQWRASAASGTVRVYAPN
jgi:hypothetical protein